MENKEVASHREYRILEGDKAACVDNRTFEALGDPDLRELRDDSEQGECGLTPITICTRNRQLLVVSQINRFRDVSPVYECRRYFLNLFKEWQVVIDEEKTTSDTALHWLARGGS